MRNNVLVRYSDKSPYGTLSPFLAGFVLEGHCLSCWHCAYCTATSRAKPTRRGSKPTSRFDTKFIRARAGRRSPSKPLRDKQRQLACSVHDHAVSHAATTVLGVFLALPLAIYAHARMTARIAATRAPYAARLALTVLAFVFCVTAASLLCFEACRAPCRAWVGVGCLRA